MFCKLLVMRRVLRLALIAVCLGLNCDQADAGIVYFAAEGDGGVFQLDTSDSSISPIVQTPTVEPFGLAIVGKNLVWTEFGGRKIRTVDFDGGNLRTLYEQDGGQLLAPYAISNGIDSGTFIWSDTQLDGLFRGDLAGTAAQRINIDSNVTGEIKGLEIDRQDNVARFHHQASRARLYEFVLPNGLTRDITPPNDPLGEARGLATDFQNSLLYVGVLSQIYEFDLNSDTSRLVGQLPNNRIDDVAFSRSSGLVYFSSSSARSIYELNPTSGQINAFSTGTLTPRGLATDGAAAVPEPSALLCLMALLFTAVFFGKCNLLSAIFKPDKLS